MPSHAIKINGKFEIPEPLAIDRSYDIKLTVGINSISKHSEENGDYEYVYSAKPETGEIEKDNGEVFKLKSKSSQSALLRGQLRYIADERGLDREQFYDLTMGQIRGNLMAILDFLKGLENE